MGSDGVRLSVDDDVFKLEVGDAGGIELVVLDGDVEIFEEYVADVGLAGVAGQNAAAPDLVMRSSRVDAAKAFAASGQRGAEARRELKRRRE
jgi:hypothetical protein